MTNQTLRLLRSRGLITGEVIPFNRTNLVTLMTDRYPDRVVMEMNHDVRPGPFWLVTKEDGQRLQAAGHKLAIQP
jgi:hypothetical protein